MSQGFRLSGFLMSLTFATFTLGAMGWYAAVGVGFDTGLMSEARTVTSNINNASAQATGSTNIGFFGIAVGVAETLQTLAILNVELFGVLISFGTPAPIALPLQLMYNFVFGLTVLAVFRGFQIIS